jgi:hypothetical protein
MEIKYEQKKKKKQNGGKLPHLMQTRSAPGTRTHSRHHMAQMVHSVHSSPLRSYLLEQSVVFSVQLANQRLHAHLQQQKQFMNTHEFKMVLNRIHITKTRSRRSERFFFEFCLVEVGDTRQFPTERFRWNPNFPQMEYSFSETSFQKKLQYGYSTAKS